MYSGDLVGVSCRHGTGRMMYKRGSANYSYYTGAVYEGSYSNNKASGEGVLTLADGEVYRGEFRADLKHGRGKLVLANGDAYEGQFVDGVKQGEGEYIWANGDKYIGEWRKDKKNGKGVLMRAHGRENPTMGQWSGDVCYWQHKYRYKHRNNTNCYYKEKQQNKRADK